MSKCARCNTVGDVRPHNSSGICFDCATKAEASTPAKAEEIADDFGEGRYNYLGGYKFTVNELALLLTSYANAVAETRVKTAHNSSSGQCDICTSGITIARNEALEEAAKVVETPISGEDLDKCYGCDCHGEIPQDFYPPLIRALKGPERS